MYGAKTKYNPSGFSWPLKMGPIGCPETSVRNYHYSLRNNSEERISNSWHSEVSKTFTQLESLARSLTHIESFIQTGQHKHGKTRIWFDAVGGTVSVTMPAVGNARQQYLGLRVHRHQRLEIIYLFRSQGKLYIYDVYVTVHQLMK